MIVPSGIDNINDGSWCAGDVHAHSLTLLTETHNGIKLEGTYLKCLYSPTYLTPLCHGAPKLFKTHQ